MSQSELIRYLHQAEMFADRNYPLSSNRGVIDPETPLVWSHLDYLSLTYDYPARMFASRFYDTPLPKDWFDWRGKEAGISWYRQAARLDPAGTLFWNDGEKGVGSLAVFSGSDLIQIRNAHHTDDKEILQRLARNARNVTRLDFCTNIDAGDPDELWKWHEAGKVKARGKKPRRDENFGSGNGYTLYYGARGADKVLRVYDKIAELKLDGGVWTRIELQLRNKPAKALADTMLRNDLKASGKTAIRAFCDPVGLSWYQDAVESDNIEMNLTPAKETSFERWLSEQVGPAIEKRIEGGESVGFIAEWLEKYIRIVTGEILH